ncbi:acyl-CoA dehydrogenase family protein [Streptomyces zagrosensis]|uniref:Alkylation response protein AidB-like acyl-CoA dehydrogenase n=1 Tax=Streptomyces zagrosensis TaxID=1042984 RepID=A0A7W9V240_9ACTN|nr:acyl-CoA dehydrogenase family protein [Streptomyces zagrosensis]MBB5939933.1 alkylation response protein AidB-like acyl-CoA dehydrogenase [Streptomyces zagrosensis]
MTAFALDPQQREWCATLRAIAAEQLRPLAARCDPGRVNRPLVAALGESGLLRRLFPLDGQAPVRALDLCLLRESLARECTQAETALALQGLGCYPVVQSGTPEQRARWLPEVVAGRAVAAFALSEPGAGSDAAALTLAAEPAGARSGPRGGPRGSAGLAGRVGRDHPVGGVAAGGEEAGGADENGAGDTGPVGSTGPAGLAGCVGRTGTAGRVGRTDGPGRAQSTGVSRAAGWRLTGEKCWISNAPEADFYTVFARTTPGAGSRGITAFLVPADRPGLTGEHLDMLSPHPIGRLFFDAVPVTRADVLGEVDAGFQVAMRTLNLLRPSVGAFAVGMARSALDLALAHAKERTAFGGPLKDLQAVAHQLAEMATRTEAAQLLVYAAASAHDAGESGIARRSAMAKLLATETAQYVVDAAVQIHGARALERGHPLEHLYREVRAPRIYEGATEVQRTIIAKELYR